MLNYFNDDDVGRMSLPKTGAGPSRPRHRSLSSDRIESPETQRLRALREESFVRQDSLEHAVSEVRNLKAEMRVLNAEVQRSKDHAERLKTELRECYMRERFLDEVRVQSREDGYREAMNEYRQRMILNFPGIDISLLPNYVAPANVSGM